MRRVAIIASASGNGKTTLGRELASRLDVPFVELDALVHGPNWTQLSDEGLRAALAPILPRPGWVIDGGYHGKIGDLVIDAADTIVWLDLPLRVWLPRPVRRTRRRIRATSASSTTTASREDGAGRARGADPVRAQQPLPAAA